MLTFLVALIALVIAGPIIIAILVDLFRLFGAILPILLFGVLAVSTIHVLFN